MSVLKKPAGGSTGSFGDRSAMGPTTSYTPVDRQSRAAAVRTETDEEQTERQMKVARRIMAEDRDILRELAK